MVCRHHRLLPLPAVLGARYKANTSIWFHGNKEYLYYWRELWRNLFGNNGFINGKQGRKSEIFKESRSPALPSPPPYPRRPSKKFTQSFQDENESLRYFFTFYISGKEDILRRNCVQNLKKCSGPSGQKSSSRRDSLTKFRIFGVLEV